MKALGYLIMEEMEVEMANYIVKTTKIDPKVEKYVKNHPFQAIEWWRYEEACRAAILPYILATSRQNAYNILETVG